MNRATTEQQIAKDLELCDLIEAIGSKSNKRKARTHRKACFDAVKQMNAEDGLDMTDDELFEELSK